MPGPLAGCGALGTRDNQTRRHRAPAFLAPSPISPYFNTDLAQVVLLPPVPFFAPSRTTLFSQQALQSQPWWPVTRQPVAPIHLLPFRTTPGHLQLQLPLACFQINPPILASANTLPRAD